MHENRTLYGPNSGGRIYIKKGEKRNRQLTWRPSFTISGWRIEFQATWDLSLGSQSMVLLNANPDIATWNLRSLLLSSLVCHPTTWFCLHTGPSSTTPSFLFSEITGTGHVPNLLIITRVCNKSTAWIICSNQCNFLSRTQNIIFYCSRPNVFACQTFKPTLLELKSSKA